MCINVFKKEVDIFYRVICLIAFGIVIIFSNNIATYFLLGLFLLFGCLKKEKLNIFILIIITIIAFLINNFFLIKIILIIDYAFYFMGDNYIKKDVSKKSTDKYYDTIYNSNKKKITNVLEKGDIDSKIIKEIEDKTKVDLEKKKENLLLRYHQDKVYIKKNNSDIIYYVAFHLIILFLSILIGSCAI